MRRRPRLPGMRATSQNTREQDEAHSDSATHVFEPSRLMRDLQMWSLIDPPSESRVKVLTAVDKFDVARRMPKNYSKTYQVRKHIACQRRRLNASPVFASTIDRGSPAPWERKQADFDYSLSGAEDFHSNRNWRTSRIPQMNPLSRWDEAVEGKFLRRYMHQKNVKNGEHVDLSLIHI
eukprot:TRINITY_DN8826_c0_g1_i2.p1 TRINITY_DN8826_c0_g1~~TRINITY_DN8826_c0_g1_i2.p1  ORF type:complete len:178 (+),score=16.99 TRINITY_DN8826_c0_g1_i2:83-616(+)